jgi:4-hydroxy-4-methyl-2-oxoglutarate aldolase
VKDLCNPIYNTLPGRGIESSLLHRARLIPVATLHEAAGRAGALPSQIKPVAPRFRICGSAVPVHSPAGDNLWIHRALYAAQPGSVLVVSVSGATEYGYWGEVMSTAARVRDLAGLVIDGCVRDGELLEQIGFPVFARGLCVVGTNKDFGATGWINAPVMLGDVTVHAGDLVVGDLDGVVIVENQRVVDILQAAEERTSQESKILERIEAGETTLSIYGWV